MNSNVFERMYQESFNFAIILPEKVSMFYSFALQAMLFVIAQGNSDLIDCEAFQTGFWKKIKSRRGGD